MADYEVFVGGGRGAKGWSPVLVIADDDERRVFQVSDWIGSTGSKPETGQYLGAEGLVDDIEDAVDVRGPMGEDVLATLIAQEYLPEGSTYEDMVEWLQNPANEAGETVLQAISAAADAALTAVGNAETDSVAAVGLAGTTQVDLVNETGAAQALALNAAGAAQIDVVEAAGIVQTTAVGAAGDAQALILYDAVNDPTTGHLKAISDAGDTEVAGVVAEGDTQVARLASSTDTHLLEIAAAAAISGNIWPDTAAGLAANLTIGAFWLVVGDGIETAYLLYETTTGPAATIRTRVPDLALLQSAIAGMLGMPGVVDLMKDKHTSTDLIGVITPATGSAIANITAVSAKRARKDGHIYEIGCYGVNSGGANALQVKICSYAGGNLTQVSQTTHTIVAGLNVLTPGSGMADTIPVSAGQYIGFRAWQTNGKISVLGSTSPPFNLYFTHSGDQTGTFARGALTVNSQPQIYFKVRYKDGSEEIFHPTRTVYAGRPAGAMTTTGTALTGSGGAITWIATPLWGKRLTHWQVGCETAGTMHCCIGHVLGDGNINITHYFPVTVSVGDNNITSQIPNDIEIIPGRTLRGYSVATGMGSIAYNSNSANGIEREPYSVTTTLAGDILGPNPLTYGTAVRRYEDRIGMLTWDDDDIDTQDNGVLIDEDFSEGVRPHGILVTTNTFAPGKAIMGSTGMNTGITAVIRQAWHKVKAEIRFNMRTSTRVFAGIRPNTSLAYGTVITMNSATDEILIHNNWPDNGTTTPATFATIANPFPTPINDTTSYMVEFVRDRRAFHIRVFDMDEYKMAQVDSGHSSYAASVAANSTCTVDINTWYPNAESDLSDIGQMVGSPAFGALTGTGAECTRMFCATPIRSPKVVIVSDSMAVSREDWSLSLAGRLEAAMPDGDVLIACVDGSTIAQTRDLLSRSLPLHPTLERIVIAAGFDDGPGAGYTLQDAINDYLLVVYRCQDRGITPIICDVFPQRLLTYKEDITETITATPNLRTLAATLGVENVRFRLSFGIPGSSPYIRDEPWFYSTHDSHLSPAGHERAFRQLALEARSLRLPACESPPTRAFVRFSVSGGVVTIRKAVNVASVVRTDTGDFTINFSHAFPDQYYGGHGMGSRAGSGDALICARNRTSAWTTSAAYLTCTRESGAPEDPAEVSMTFGY